MGGVVPVPRFQYRASIRLAREGPLHDYGRKMRLGMPPDPDHLAELRHEERLHSAARLSQPVRNMARKS